jgi:hypothetical protein
LIGRTSTQPSTRTRPSSSAGYWTTLRRPIKSRYTRALRSSIN